MLGLEVLRSTVRVQKICRPSYQQNRSKRSRPPLTSSGEIRKAINELNAYSDRELTENGINHGSIKDVACYGRTDVELSPKTQKRAA